MAAIYSPRIRITNVKPVAADGDYKEYTITAEVKFTLYSDAPEAVAVEELKEEAQDKLVHALS